MALSQLDAFLPRKIVGNMGIWVIPQSEEYSPSSEAGDLTVVSDTEWQNVARCRVATYEVTTENDEEDSFDAKTKTRVKMENAQVSARRWQLELERYTVAFDAMYQGVANPLSPETQEKLSAGAEVPVPIYASNNPYIPVGVKICMYDGEQNLLKTMYFYANARCDGNQQFDGKIIRPTLVLEVETSTHNCMTLSAAFTGQKEQA